MAKKNSDQLQKPLDLAPVDVLALDYGGKLALLDRVTSELLELRLEFAHASARYAELKANITVLGEIKQALQTSLKAEGGL